MKGSFLFRGGLRLQERKKIKVCLSSTGLLKLTCVMGSGIEITYSIQQFGFLLNYIINIPYSYFCHLLPTLCQLIS